MKIIDLTRTIYSGMDVYPGDPEVKIEVAHTFEVQTWLLRYLKMGSHTGTHVDAFSHMKKFGKTLDKIPLDKFYGIAKVVTSETIFPKKTGLVFLKGDTLDLSIFNKLLKANPLFVAIEMGVKWSVELERKLLQNKVITYTGLMNCNLLPKNKTFMFYGFPLKIKDGDGSPVRAVAILN
ncbi:cyclase [Candidatus Woesebacteria bacterium CG06_land_8_20_14_3_00_39_27]|uniref:Cyclase n=1 Tax=Candidatus Woesebacteria bacterium CG06_land_8_20_14_3_00_39_27 TaxID=1975057 RepID=A0A2M7APY6_9BACT|nr:MAG: cyclase [Candidatus Woesebacteria bacterium CG06_land_8_20_14_3_00_39_27]